MKQQVQIMQVLRLTIKRLISAPTDKLKYINDVENILNMTCTRLYWKTTFAGNQTFLNQSNEIVTKLYTNDVLIN
jgi:hypothetical protein